MADQPERDPHAATRDAFPEYATALALGRRAEREYPEVAAHLVGCDDCRRELVELVVLLAPSYAGEVATAPATARPNLDFLRQPLAARPRWRLDELGRLVFALGDALAAALTPVRFATAARGTLLQQFSGESDLAGGLRVVVEVWQDDPAQQLGRLRVSVDRLTADPLAQERVAVALIGGAVAQQGSTDELGQVEFTALPLAALSQVQLVIGT